MFRKENGVTLVALVITIIVLLILAGVTISMVLGDDGIIGNAETAKDTYSLTDIQSKANLAAMVVRSSAVTRANVPTASTASNKYATFDAASVKTAMSALFNAGEATLTDPSGDAFDCTVGGVTYTVTVDTTKYTAVVSKD